MVKGKAGLVLPPRMRAKQTSSGKTYFYYDTCAKPRKWLPLGADYLAALKKYADLDLQYNDKMAAAIADATTFEYVGRRYFKEVVPGKAIATQRDNVREFGKLLEFFGSPPAPINAIEPKHIAQYIKWRSQTAKVRANREVALFSSIFNKAREWGYTTNANPTLGVKKNKETGRGVYVSDDVFWSVYECAALHIRYVMLVAYLAGQRVTDTLEMSVDDIRDGALWVQQNKGGTRLRIELVGVFAEVVAKIMGDRDGAKHSALFVNSQGEALTYGMLRYGMDKARRLAGVDKADFQFRDLRAKSGTDKDEELGLDAARALLGHKSTSMTTKYVRHRKGKLVAPARQDIDRKKAKM